MKPIFSMAPQSSTFVNFSAGSKQFHRNLHTVTDDFLGDLQSL